MKRLREWILATTATIIGLATAAFTVSSQTAAAAPAASIWPLPGLIVLSTTLVAMVGFAAVVFNRTPSSSLWSKVTWIVAGVLAAITIFSAFSIGPLLMAATLAFGGAAALANRRQGQKLAPGLGVFVFSAMMSLGLIIVTLTVVGG